jgi:hypothetical protein
MMGQERIKTKVLLRLLCEVLEHLKPPRLLGNTPSPSDRGYGVKTGFADIDSGEENLYLWSNDRESHAIKRRLELGHNLPSVD